MGKNTIDKRKILQKKSIEECIDYSFSLVPILIKSQNNALKQVELLHDAISKIPEDIKSEIKGISWESLFKLGKYSELARCLEGINNLREDIGSKDWEAWGTKIRSLRNKRKYRELRLLKNTRKDFHLFMKDNQAQFQKQFSDEIDKMESIALNTQNVKTKRFSEILNNELSNERFFDDLQFRMLLKQAQLKLNSTNESLETQELKEKIFKLESMVVEANNKIRRSLQKISSKKENKINAGKGLLKDLGNDLEQFIDENIEVEEDEFEEDFELEDADESDDDFTFEEGER